MVDFYEIGLIAFRSCIAILVLLFTTRMLGKKQISQLTFYDYVVGITIGSIAADSIITLDEHFINGMAAIAIFGLIAISMSILAIKSKTINKALNGVPSILMENGSFLFGNLKKSKITVDKFIEQARIHGYYDLNVLNYAILETTGEISFLPKEEYQVSTPIDFKSDTKKGTKQTYCEVIISDGQIDFEKLEKLGKDEEWLKKELDEKNVGSIDEVVLATIDEKNKVRVYEDSTMR